VIGPFDNSYMRIDKPHPVLEGFTGTKMMPGAEFRVPVSHLPVEERYLSVIPHYAPFPVALTNAVHWLLKDQSPAVTVDGDGVIDIFAWETEPGFAVHILNYTNPNMTRPYITKFYPIGPMQVKFRVPNEKKINFAKALRANRTLTFKQTGDIVAFEVSSVLDYEVIALL
jgi:hypothetical protein